MSIILFSLTLIYVLYLILLVRFNYNFKKPPRVHPRTGNIVPISVIVAVKNGDTSLPLLINCLKNQTYTGEVEYIIVDDQSTDNTKSIIDKISNEDNRFIFASSLDGEERLSFKKKALDSGIKLAKHEGLFCEPTSAAAFAGLEILINKKHINKNERVLIPITGSGLKDVFPE